MCAGEDVATELLGEDHLNFVEPGAEVQATFQMVEAGVDSVEATAALGERLGNRAHGLVEVFLGEWLGHRCEVK